MNVRKREREGRKSHLESLIKGLRMFEERISKDQFVSGTQFSHLRSKIS